MGWNANIDGHEGVAAAYFPDGNTGSGWATPPGGGAPGLIVSVINGQRGDSMKDWQYRSPDDVTGWRADCECGWRGPLHRLGDRVPSVGTGPRTPRFGDAPADIEDACYAEWLDHVRPVEGTAEVNELVNEYAAVGRKLDAAVRAARSRGASWAAIGEAAGITRQSAWERWRHLDPASTSAQ